MLYPLVQLHQVNWLFYQSRKKLWLIMDFALTPNFHIESDLSNIDFCKVKKHMMLVAKRVTIQFFQRQMMWPKKCLSPQAPGTKSPNTTICLFQR